MEDKTYATERALENMLKEQETVAGAACVAHVRITLKNTGRHLVISREPYEKKMRVQILDEDDDFKVLHTYIHSFFESRPLMSVAYKIFELNGESLYKEG